MNSGITPSEKYVSNLCKNSFLRLWTHPNPIGKKGKELCDCLVVCGIDIIVISVKECKYKDTGDVTGWHRWIKTVIKKSESQIYGAERWLEEANQVERNDGRIISLPNKRNRRYHRITVALGAVGKVPLQWGDSGKGFIHLCDEYSMDAMFLGLDTITDFVLFLNSTENLVKESRVLFSGGGVEDLVAIYIQNRHSFSFDNITPSMIIVDSGIWKSLVNSKEFEDMTTDLVESYSWDRLIDTFANDLLTDGLFDFQSKQVTQNELALVEMAIQPRGYRANLAEALLEYFNNPELKSAARVVNGYAETAFVFMAGSSTDREARYQELALRCLVVRGRMPGVKKVVGIATDKPGSSSVGYSSEIIYTEFNTWNEELENKVKEIQESLGYFKNIKWQPNN